MEGVREAGREVSGQQRARRAMPRAAGGQRGGGGGRRTCAAAAGGLEQAVHPAEHGAGCALGIRVKHRALRREGRGGRDLGCGRGPAFEATQLLSYTRGRRGVATSRQGTSVGFPPKVDGVGQRQGRGPAWDPPQTNARPLPLLRHPCLEQGRHGGARRVVQQLRALRQLSTQPVARVRIQVLQPGQGLGDACGQAGAVVRACRACAGARSALTGPGTGRCPWPGGRRSPGVLQGMCPCQLSIGPCLHTATGSWESCLRPGPRAPVALPSSHQAANI